MRQVLSLVSLPVKQKARSGFQDTTGPGTPLHYITLYVFVLHSERKQGQETYRLSKLDKPKNCTKKFLFSFRYWIFRYWIYRSNNFFKTTKMPSAYSLSVLILKREKKSQLFPIQPFVK